MNCRRAILGLTPPFHHAGNAARRAFPRRYPVSQEIERSEIIALQRSDSTSASTSSELHFHLLSLPSECRHQALHERLHYLLGAPLCTFPSLHNESLQSISEQSSLHRQAAQRNLSRESKDVKLAALKEYVWCVLALFACSTTGMVLRSSIPAPDAKGKTTTMPSPLLSPLHRSVTLDAIRGVPQSPWCSHSASLESLVHLCSSFATGAQVLRMVHQCCGSGQPNASYPCSLPLLLYWRVCSSRHVSPAHQLEAVRRDFTKLSSPEQLSLWLRCSADEFCALPPNAKYVWRPSTGANVDSNRFSTCFLPCYDELLKVYQYIFCMGCKVSSLAPRQELRDKELSLSVGVVICLQRIVSSQSNKAEAEDHQVLVKPLLEVHRLVTMLSTHDDNTIAYWRHRILHGDFLDSTTPSGRHALLWSELVRLDANLLLSLGHGCGKADDFSAWLPLRTPEAERELTNCLHRAISLFQSCYAHFKLLKEVIERQQPCTGASKQVSTSTKRSHLDHQEGLLTFLSANLTPRIAGSLQERCLHALRLSAKVLLLYRRRPDAMRFIHSTVEQVMTELSSSCFAESMDFAVLFGELKLWKASYECLTGLLRKAPMISDGLGGQGNGGLPAFHCLLHSTLFERSAMSSIENYASAQVDEMLHIDRSDCTLAQRELVGKWQSFAEQSTADFRSLLPPVVVAYYGFRGAAAALSRQHHLSPALRLSMLTQFFGAMTPEELQEGGRLPPLPQTWTAFLSAFESIAEDYHAQELTADLATEWSTAVHLLVRHCSALVWRHPRSPLFSHLLQRLLSPPRATGRLSATPMWREAKPTRSTRKQDSTSDLTAAAVERREVAAMLVMQIFRDASVASTSLFSADPTQLKVCSHEAVLSSVWKNIDPLVLKCLRQLVVDEWKVQVPTHLGASVPLLHHAVQLHNILSSTEESWSHTNESQDSCSTPWRCPYCFFWNSRDCQECSKCASTRRGWLLCRSCASLTSLPLNPCEWKSFQSAPSATCVVKCDCCTTPLCEVRTDPVVGWHSQTTPLRHTIDSAPDGGQTRGAVVYLHNKVARLWWWKSWTCSDCGSLHYSRDANESCCSMCRALPPLAFTASHETLTSEYATEPAPPPPPRHPSRTCRECSATSSGAPRLSCLTCGLAHPSAQLSSWICEACHSLNPSSSRRCIACTQTRAGQYQQEQNKSLSLPSLPTRVVCGSCGTQGSAYHRRCWRCGVARTMGMETAPPLLLHSGPIPPAMLAWVCLQPSCLSTSVLQLGLSPLRVTCGSCGVRAEDSYSVQSFLEEERERWMAMGKCESGSVGEMPSEAQMQEGLKARSLQQHPLAFPRESEEERKRPSALFLSPYFILPPFLQCVQPGEPLSSTRSLEMLARHSPSSSAVRFVVDSHVVSRQIVLGMKACLTSPALTPEEGLQQLHAHRRLREWLGALPLDALPWRGVDERVKSETCHHGSQIGIPVWSEVLEGSEAAVERLHSYMRDWRLILDSICDRLEASVSVPSQGSQSVAHGRNAELWVEEALAIIDVAYVSTDLDEVGFSTLLRTALAVMKVQHVDVSFKYSVEKLRRDYLCNMRFSSESIKKIAFPHKLS